MVSYDESGNMSIDYKKLHDKNYKADDYKVDESIENGPKPDRKCTDVLCCIAYWIVVVLLLVWCIVAYCNGDPEAFVFPVSSDSVVCGVRNTDSYDYPYLYVPIISSLSDTKQSDAISEAVAISCCVNVCPFEQNQEGLQFYGCSKNDQGDVSDVYQTEIWHKYCLPNPQEPNTYTADQKAGMKLFTGNWQSVSLGNYVMSIYNARWVMTISIFIALILALGYIKFMDWCAYWLSWIVIACAQLSLILLGVAAFVELHDCNETNPPNCPNRDISLYQATMWSSWIAALLFCLCLACKFKSLRISIAIIETAADFFADSKRIIIVPIIYFCIGVGVFIIWFFGIMCLAASGTIMGNPDQDVWADRSALINDRIAWMVIFYIWVATLIHSLNEYCIIVSTCTWYFSRKDIPDDDGIPGDSDIWKGFWWSYRYNFGSLALGSGILTILTLVREAIAYMGDAVLASTGGNPCTACLICCCNCYMDCFDRFVRFLNQNAYIYMALSGEGFCISALHAFLVVLKNMAKFSFVNSIAGIFMFLAKFSIAILTTLASWGLLKVWPDSYTDGTDTSPGYMLPCLFIFCLSYVIATMFISIFDVASNTILMCYIWDQEILKEGGKVKSNHIPPTLAAFLEGNVHEEEEEKAVATAEVTNAEEKQNLLS